MSNEYSEYKTVQHNTAKYSEQQLRWELIYVYNNEDIGQNCLPRLMNGEVAV